MPTVPLLLGHQSNPSRHPAAGSCRIFNCYMEPGGEEASAQTPLWAVSGLSVWATLAGGGGIRAMLATANHLYVVAGRVLFRVDSSGNATALGGIPTEGPVFMARNRREPEPEIGIVSDGLYWIVTNATLVENTDTDLPAASSIDVIDGHFILPGYGNAWYITEADEATSVDPLDFASAESSPDAIVRVATRESEIVLFGADTVEWWQNTGASFPFARVQTARIGCLGAGTVARIDRTLAWVADDHTVRLMQGYGGQVISIPAVARDVEADADKAGMTATAWAEGGTWFYSLSGSTWTWEYNLGTGKWHQRKSYGSSRWRCGRVVPFAGLTLAGDRSSGTIYRMSRDVHTEGSDPLVMEVVAPAAKAFPGDIVVDRLALRMVTGTGLVPGSAATTEPVVMAQISRDGGVTFGPERHLSLGARGNRGKVIESYRWGKAQSAVFRLTCSAAVQRGFLEASIDYTPLR